MTVSISLSWSLKPIVSERGGRASPYASEEIEGLRAYLRLGMQLVAEARLSRVVSAVLYPSIVGA